MHETSPAVALRIETLRAALRRVAPNWDQDSARFEQLLTEWTPFVECALQAESLVVHTLERDVSARSTLDNSPAWKEARSMAWLFAHRMGDQEVPVVLLTYLLQAWRLSGVEALSGEVQDDVLPLLFDGYTRGCEERLRLLAQRNMGEHAVIRELWPGTLLVVAAGPLENEAARIIVDRASREALRRDSKVLILDLDQLHMPPHSVIAELWTMLPGIRTLGAQIYIAGVRGVVAEVLMSLGLRDEGEVRCETLSQAILQIKADDSRSAHRPKRSAVAWLKFWQRRKT